MSHWQRKWRSGLTLLVVALVGASVTGCRGEDGDQIGVATGQSPDPVVVDIPIVYVKRSLGLDDNGDLIPDNARDAMTFSPGADVFVRDRASPSAVERNVTEAITQGMGDVRDLAVSYDGTRVVFSLREPMIEGLDDDEQPKWNIWEYDLVNDELRRVISSDIVAEGGHDVDPVYLADDRIVFSSTRQRTMKAILLDEGKPQFEALTTTRNEPAFLLHVMDNDGSDIEQISYNMSHDLEPSVLSDGRIVFQRWDNAGDNNAINLYTINPDGTSLELLYGALSHETGTDGGVVQFLKPKQLPDGRILSLVRDFIVPTGGGDLVAIDVDRFVENQQPVLVHAGMPGPAQESATLNQVSTDSGVSTGGRYLDAFPLFDGTDRLFFSWSDCRVELEQTIRPCTDEFLNDPDAVEAPPLYGLWIYDPSNGTQLPVVLPQEGVSYSEIVAAQARPFPPVAGGTLGALAIDPNAVEEDVGILHVRSVYDIAGRDLAPNGVGGVADPARTAFAQRSRAFVRLTKAVSEIDRDVRDVPREAFGPTRRLGMREILGYAVVEPDGSVMTKVPANVSFQLEILNGTGRRVTWRHNNWLQVRAGELLECNGCHRANEGVSHGRDGLFASVNPGALTTGLPFPNSNPDFFADFGETMAQVRARISCATDCAMLNPQLDLVYDDVWTDPVAAGRPPDPSFAWRYVDLLTPAPVSPDCQTNWSSLCRVVINYEEHIHPLWSLPRITLADDDVTVLSDYTCSGCHNPLDGDANAQVPAAQLDLSDGPSPDNADQFKSYRELMFGDNEQEVVDATLVDRLIEVGIDPETMEPIFQTVGVAAPIGGTSAVAATRFFAPFAPGGVHEGYLTPAELKLMSEWIDIGAQYYNNPFAAGED